MTDPTIPPDSQEFQYLKSIGALDTPPAPAVRESVAATKKRLDAIDADQRRAELFAQLTGGRP